ncbi:MAG: DCC1-like thiol-disulfide oxidoreductase family protein [Nitrospira sp.]
MRAPLPACPLDPQQPSLFVYDSHCRLCVAVKNGLERAGLSESGAGITMIPYDSQEARSVLGDRYQPGPPSMAYLVSPAGAVSQGIGTVLPLVAGLPGGRAVRWMLKWAPIMALAEGAYRWIARHRYRLFGAVKPSIR